MLTEDEAGRALQSREVKRMRCGEWGVSQRHRIAPCPEARAVCWGLLCGWESLLHNFGLGGSGEWTHNLFQGGQTHAQE